MFRIKVTRIKEFFCLRPSKRWVVNYFWKKNFFQLREKQRVNNDLKPLILSVFTIVASRFESEQKEKGKIHIETKYNTI